MRLSFSLVSVIAGLVTVVPPAAADEPTFSKQIKPFLAKYCTECHNHDDADGGFVVESFELFLKGGEHGATLVPGKPDESRLVLQLEGKAKPKMPPKDAKQFPMADEIALVRSWVAAGAKNDAEQGGATPAKVPLPPIKPRAAVAPKINAMAFSPDGRVLAVAAYKEVVLLNPADGTFFAKFPLPSPPGRGAGGEGGGSTPVATSHATAADPITALAISRDGKWLAVATGSPSERGDVHLYAMPAAPISLGGAADLKPAKSFTAHADLIHAVEFSPDGKLLATAGYDRLVKIWNAETGAELKTLKDHSDSVYSIAWSPDSKLLASGAADRAVKVWDVASGRRLYTLGDSTDWVYAVAWSADGKHLAAAGIDKSIRVWNATDAGGRLVFSTFAHDGPITRLAYSADSKTLFSLSEDRTVKAWDANGMIERQHFEKLPETPLALAVGPKNQLAVGRFDGAVDFFDASTGKRPREPLAVAAAKPAPKPEPPVLASLRPRGAERGKTVRVVLDGKNLNLATELAFSGSPAASAFTAKLVQDDETAKNPNRAKADVTIPADTPRGVIRIAVKSPVGNTAELPFAVSPFAEIAESAGMNDSQGAAQKIALPATLVGSLEKAGDIDYFRFDAAAGQQLGIEVVAGAIGSKLEPVLALADDSGRVLGESAGNVLGYRFEQAGSYTLRIRDVDYRGAGDMFYRVNLGDLPVITDVFPLGLARGAEIDVAVGGVNLGDVKTVKVKAAESADPGSRVDVPVKLAAGSPIGAKQLVVGEFAESSEPAAPHADAASAVAVPTPVTINGRIERPGETDLYRFTAKRGERLILDVNARRLGSPLDSFIEILDARGQPLPRATLRCVAKTVVVFRDHDSATAGIRIENWNELAVNDFVMLGNELLKIDALPKNPDDDCRFFEARGSRVGYLDTTPAHHALGEPVYKVSLHPPGTPFAPNGMPVFTIVYRNDDGGPQYGKDSRLFFDPPADGEYLVRIGDVRGHGGMSHAYRLAIRPPKPSYMVSFSPTSPAVWKGGAIPIAVSCERFDGFEGPIEVRLDNLPPGFSAPVTTIPPGENATSLALFADAGATAPAKDAAKLKLVAKAAIDGTDFSREVEGGSPSAVEPGDIITTVEQSEVTIQPGRESKLTVHIERRGDFKGRIPIEVRGLPHGTRVLDIGLNGILITERDTERTITIYSEPWAAPTTHPFVVLAKREGKNTEHAAKSVLLKVVPAASLTAAP